MQISASIGLCQYKESETYEAFIIRSEKLMEEAKHLGGNRIINTML